MTKKSLISKLSVFAVAIVAIVAVAITVTFKAKADSTTDFQITGLNATSTNYAAAGNRVFLAFETSGVTTFDGTVLRQNCTDTTTMDINGTEFTFANSAVSTAQDVNATYAGFSLLFKKEAGNTAGTSPQFYSESYPGISNQVANVIHMPAGTKFGGYTLTNEVYVTVYAGGIIQFGAPEYQDASIINIYPHPENGNNFFNIKLFEGAGNIDPFNQSGLIKPASGVVADTLTVVVDGEPTVVQVKANATNPYIPVAYLIDFVQANKEIIIPSGTKFLNYNIVTEMRFKFVDKDLEALPQRFEKLYNKIGLGDGLDLVDTYDTYTISDFIRDPATPGTYVPSKQFPQAGGWNLFQLTPSEGNTTKSIVFKFQHVTEAISTSSQTYIRLKWDGTADPGFVSVLPCWTNGNGYHNQKAGTVNNYSEYGASIGDVVEYEIGAIAYKNDANKYLTYVKINGILSTYVVITAGNGGDHYAANKDAFNIAIKPTPSDNDNWTINDTGYTPVEVTEVVYDEEKDFRFVKLNGAGMVWKDPTGHYNGSYVISQPGLSSTLMNVETSNVTKAYKYLHIYFCAGTWSSEASNPGKVDENKHFPTDDVVYICDKSGNVVGTQIIPLKGVGGSNQDIVVTLPAENFYVDGVFSGFTIKRANYEGQVFFDKIVLDNVGSILGELEQVSAEAVTDETIKTVVTSKIKQMDQSTKVDGAYTENGTPIFVKTNDGARDIYALYFSRSEKWGTNDSAQNYGFSEFRLPVTAKYGKKITFEYRLLEYNQGVSYPNGTDKASNCKSYVELKTKAGTYINAAGNQTAYYNPLIADGNWHIYELDIDNVQAELILIKIYHFIGEFLVSEVNVHEHTHAFSEWTTITEATYMQAGLKKRTCSICNEEETENVPIKTDKVLLPQATVVDASAVTNESIKTILTNKVKQFDQSIKNEGAYTDNGELVYVKTKKGTEDVYALYFSRFDQWGDRSSANNYGLSSFRIETAVKYTSKITITYKMVEYNQSANYGTAGDKSSFCKSYIEVKSAVNGAYTNVEGNQSEYHNIFIADGEWHTLEIACDNIQINTIMFNIYNFIGEMFVSDIQVVEHTHAYPEWTVTTPVTCTTNGARERTCTICNEKVSETITATGHAYGEAKQNNRGILNGYVEVTQTCANCGDVKVLQTINLAQYNAGLHLTGANVGSANAYEWNKATMTLNVKAMSEGANQWANFTFSPTQAKVKYAYLVLEGSENMNVGVKFDADGNPYDGTSGNKVYKGLSGKTEVIVWDLEALKVDTTKIIKFVIWAYAVKDSGATTGTIKVLGAGLANTAEEISAIHNYKTAVADGANGHYMACSCGAHDATVAHTAVTDAAVNATCTEAGLTEGSHCSVCEYVIKAQEDVEATGHTEVNLDPVNATCTESGLTAGMKCSVCQTVLVEQETIPPTGHTEVNLDPVEATCTEKGLTAGKKCSVCQTILVEQSEIEAKGHEMGEWTIVTDSTYEAEGLKERCCNNCDYKETDTIPVKTKDPVTTSTVAPTTTAGEATSTVAPTTTVGGNTTTAGGNTTDAPAKKGCKTSVVASFSILAFLGATVLVAKKKREE